MSHTSNEIEEFWKKVREEVQRKLFGMNFPPNPLLAANQRGLNSGIAIGLMNSASTTVTKFNKGDRISHNGYVGTIIDICGVSPWYGEREYMVEYDDKNLLPPKMKVPEPALKLHEDANKICEKILKDPPKTNYSCECGAKFTENPNHHSNWCKAK